MRTSHRLVAITALLLTVAVALTGCIHTDRGIQLNGDGSGSYTYTLGFSEQLVSLASDQLSQQMDAYGAQVKREGGSYRHYDDTGYSYWAFTRPFRSVAQLNQQLQETPSAGAAGGAGSTSLGATATPTDSFQVDEDAGFLTNTFHVTGHMSLAGLSAPSDPSNPFPVDVSSLLKDMRESFSVTMPGWISNQSGGTVSGNTVTYTVHYGESATIDVTGGGYNTSLLYPAGAGLGVLVVGAAGGLVFWQLRRRSRVPAPAMVAPAAPAGSSVGPDAPTTR